MTWTASEDDAIAHIRAMLPSEEVDLADRVSKLHGHYLGHERDVRIEQALKALLLSIAAHRPEDAGRPDKRRIVAISGESGAGKSRALDYHARRTKAFQPYLDKDGVEVRPMIAFQVPSPCTPKRLALEGLKTLGMGVNPLARGFDPWDTFRVALKTHRTTVVMLDEVQHAFETANFVQAQQLLDTLKHLVQMPNWPVRLVLAGVSPLAEYLSSDKQMVNRMTPIPFDKLKGKEGRESTKTIVRKIVIDHAAMSMDHELEAATTAAPPADAPPGDDDFIKRLHHACDSEFGSIVETVRAAIENAMANRIDVVSVADFADVYERVSGCLPDQNVFECHDWADIERGKAFVRAVDPNEAMKREKSRSRRKQKTYKFGDRP